MIVRGPHDGDWTTLGPRLRDARITISALAAEPLCPQLVQLCQSSGGTSTTVEHLAALPAASERVAASMTAQYQIEYAIPPGSTGEIKLQLYSDQGFGEDRVVAS